MRVGDLRLYPPRGITDGFDRDSSLPTIDGRITETGGKTWQVTDGSTFPMALSLASGVDPGIPSWVQLGVAHLDAGFSDGIIHADVNTIAESNDPPFRNGLVFRYVDDLNFWAFFNYRNFAGVLGYFFRSYVAGVITDDFGFMHDGARDTGGDIPLEVVLDGTSIDGYYDGVLRVSTTSSTHLTATEHGICSYGYGVGYFSAAPL